MTRAESKFAFVLFLVADGMFFAGFAAAALVLPETEPFRSPLTALYLLHVALGVAWGGWSLFRGKPLALPLSYFRYLCAIGVGLFLLLYARLWF